jgi:hypothetical protein
VSQGSRAYGMNLRPYRRQGLASEGDAYDGLVLHNLRESLHVF